MFLLIFCLAAAGIPAVACAAESGGLAMAMPWWAWPVILFVVCFLLGVVSVLAGIGGGVLFVPVVGGFFPFGMDFVRGAALVMGVAGTLSASPRLLKQGLADLRLALPVALVASSSAIAGAMIGLLLPPDVVHVTLGVTILAIVVILCLTRRTDYPEVPKADALSAALRISDTSSSMASPRECSTAAGRIAESCCPPGNPPPPSTSSSNRWAG